MTTDEIIMALRDVDMPSASRTDLITILRTADMVKFAKAEPEAEEQTETVEQPAANSAAALYSIGGGSSFAANKRAAAEAAAPEEPEVVEAATEAAVEDLTDGKEDEGAQA
jgi:hypothetical protein